MWKEKLQLSSQKRAKSHRFSNARKLSPSIVSGLEDKLLFAPFHLASFLQNLKKVTLGVKLLQKSTKYLKSRVGITR
jgi:hypothetical protein